MEKHYSILPTTLLYSYRYLQYVCHVQALLALCCVSIRLLRNRWKPSYCGLLNGGRSSDCSELNLHVWLCLCLFPARILVLLVTKTKQKMH